MSSGVGRLWLVALVVVGVALGCGGGAATGPSPASPGSASGEGRDAATQEAPDTPGWLLEATATAPSRDEAYLEAQRRLAVAVYDSQAWAAALDMPVHDRTHDPLREEREGDGWRVHVGLTRARVAELLDRAAHQPLSVDAPAPLLRQVERALRLALVERVCRRRGAVLEAPCGPDDPMVEEGEVDAILTEVAASVRLTAGFDGGVPLGADGRPLRPVSVRAVTADGAPVAGLPLVATAPDAPKPRRAVTGADGTARFAGVGDAEWNGPLEVGVDAERLLGALAERWSGKPARIEGRRVGLARWAALVVERVQGSNAGSAVVERVLERAIRERTKGRRVQLTEGQRDRIRGATRDPSVLEGLADELAGRLDVVLFVEVDSEFASRMGAQRVWYEARGRAVAFDAWTGQALATVQTSVTESGIGDTRADQAARQALARTLVDQLLSELKPSS
jgi:hypothetical protein